MFRGCRAWNNADDGWDFFASDDVVTIDNCWAFLNGKVLSGSNTAGDGNGFKLGGAPSSAGEGGAVHIVKNSYAFDNRACGFVRNNNPEVPMLTSCGASGNGTAFCQPDELAAGLDHDDRRGRQGRRCATPTAACPRFISRSRAKRESAALGCVLSARARS